MISEGGGGLYHFPIFAAGRFWRSDVFLTEELHSVAAGVVVLVGSLTL